MEKEKKLTVSEAKGSQAMPLLKRETRCAQSSLQTGRRGDVTFFVMSGRGTMRWCGKQQTAGGSAVCKIVYD